MTLSDVRTVVLCRLPVALACEAKQHNDEMLREFTIIDAGRADGTTSDDLPARLVSMMETVRRVYGPGLDERDVQIFAAAEAGVEEIDVDQQLPVAAADAARMLGQILDEVDEFCRQGRHLLTLATPPSLVAYRRWYLSEVVEQLNGAEPTPWPQYERP